MVERQELIRWCEKVLEPNRFKDYAPNGLQVQGASHISKLATAVTASLSAMQQAVDWGADTLLVHHGWFWRSEDPCIVGNRHTRIAFALAHQLNIIAYHLPLDAHPVYGNNAQLARILGIEPQGCLDDMGLVCYGDLPQAMKVSDFADVVATRLQRPPLVVATPDQVCQRLAWCTGGGQSFFDLAIAAGVDAFITGEASEKNYHAAHEHQVAFISAGHHATERYGVLALGQAIQEHFSIPVRYMELNNPI